MVQKKITTALVMNCMPCAIGEKREDDHIGTQAPKAVCAD